MAVAPTVLAETMAVLSSSPAASVLAREFLSVGQPGQAEQRALGRKQAPWGTPSLLGTQAEALFSPEFVLLLHQAYCIKQVLLGSTERAAEAA